MYGKLTGNVLLLLVVDPLAPLPLGLDTTELVGLTAGVVEVLLTTGSLCLDLPLPRLRLLLVVVMVADVMLRPPEE